MPLSSSRVLSFWAKAQTRSAMRRRKERQRAKVEDEEDIENDKKASSSAVISSSDDEEANEDLTLKIEEKARRMRETKLLHNGGVLGGDVNCGGDVSLESSEVVTAKEQETSGEAIKASETNESAEASLVQTSDNIVLRKLLRGPRYFDPPDSNWGTCFNCGEGGHTAVNCKAEKRKKPCFICGSLEHAVKQCNKARDCFICRKGGHRAKDCPEKTTDGAKSARVCLKCGDLGHDMFQCKNIYSSDDLKEIQCYVCKEFGHLCCVDSIDGPEWEVSCYKCGQLGHDGLACTMLREETTEATTPCLCFKCGEAGHFARECSSSRKGLLEETTGAATPRFCYKCGEEGHFARECTSYRKGVLEETTGAATPSSCFKCGEEGHFARACTSYRKGLLEETTGVATPSSCFKCGEEGHFARECTSSDKARKTHRLVVKSRLIVKSLKARKEKGYTENGPAPPDIGKVHRRRKIRTDDMVASTSRKSKRQRKFKEDLEDFPSKFKERGGTTPKKSKRRRDWTFEDPEDYDYASPKPQGKPKHRGGWMTEDPEELYPRKFNNRWMTPHGTSPRWKSFNHAGSSGLTSGSTGSTNHSQHRSSVSRFHSAHANSPPRYNWW